MVTTSTILALAACCGLSSARANPPTVEGIRNIVLVHGAFVDGSGWQPVYRLLTERGYWVTVVQQPLTSLAEDVAAVRRVVDLQPGPCILVGHSYGGTVITEAGMDPKVAGLVYIAAHAPDLGETEAWNTKRMPPLARPPLSTEDGFLFLDPARFPEDFAADLPPAQAAFEAESQQLTAARVFTTPVFNPAWRVKPSWALIARSDRMIDPDLERMYARRAHSHTVEVDGSHSVYESRPKEVAALIEKAARSVR